MNVLEIKNYTMSFKLNDGIYTLLNNISLEIPSNSMIALVGESGCGKSMTIMSILKLLPKNAIVSCGEIIFNNQDLLKLNDTQIRQIRGTDIALIPQDPMTSLNPLYTIRNQLFEIINKNHNYSHEDMEKRAIEVLDIVKMSKAKNILSMYPHELSGGMKQRVIIAMAMLTKAKLILADEPTTALDVTIQNQIMNILNEIKTELSTSILLISHDLNLVGQYCDEINVMYAGEIVEKAPKESFFKNTAHPYSIALLNALPANCNINEKLNVIYGQPPNINENINGCKFHPRCKNTIGNICCHTKPELKFYNTPSHFVSCHRCKK